MKIKRLDCPPFVEELHSSYDVENSRYDAEYLELMRNDYEKAEPLFHSDGYYLVSGVVRFEYQGEAFIPKRQKAARFAFNYDFEKAEFEDVNILSQDQSRAIETLMKVGLATDEQFRLLQRDYSKRHYKRYFYK